MNIDHLDGMLTQSEDILARLEYLADLLSEAITADIEAKRSQKAAQAALDAAEAEILAEEAMKARAKGVESRLDGLAVTSKAFATACDAIVARERRDGRLAKAWALAKEAQRAADDALATRERLTIQYSATKHAADLRAAMLNTYSA